jgi:hypothetical protein
MQQHTRQFAEKNCQVKVLSVTRRESAVGNVSGAHSVRGQRFCGPNWLEAGLVMLVPGCEKERRCLRLLGKGESSCC